MTMKSYLLPESEYRIKDDISCKDLENAFSKNETVTGFVDAISKTEDELIVKFGDIKAHLPFDEVTMYPHTYSQNKARTIPVQICTLLHKKVRVKVISFENGEFTVSRKKNMQEACDILKGCQTVSCKVTSMSAKVMFCDIGDGINSIMSIREMSRSKYQNVSDCFHVGDSFYAKILSFDELGRFTISYKEMFKEYSTDDYFYGDALECTVLMPVNHQSSGMFVSVTPQVPGILDVTPWMPPLKYGDKVEAFVTRANPNGLKLKFSKIICK